MSDPPTTAVNNQPTAAQIITLKRKTLLRLGNDIKGINEQGRLASTNPTEINLFKGMFRSLDSLYSQFLAVWDELLSIHLLNPQETEFPSTPESNTQTNVKRYYYEACSHFEQLVKPTASIADSSVSMNHTCPTAGRARLPKITLPTFDGRVANWPYFRDTFTSVIHNDASLSAIEKFHFLIGSLQGEALAVIKAISIQEANYTQAWEAIQKRYDNPRKLASTYLNQLINFKPLHGKSVPSALLKFLSEVSESITAFKSLKIPKESDFILFHLAIRCLDQATREAFELKHLEAKFPSFDDLVTFVHNRCQALSMSSTDIPESSQTTKALAPNRYQHQVSKSSPNINTTTSLVMQASQSSSSQNHLKKAKDKFACFVCSKPHKLTDCPTFSKATPAERFKSLKDWKGCRNCLHPRHTTSACTSKWACRICKSPHHTMLHLEKFPSNNLPKEKVEKSPSSTHSAASQPSAALTSSSNNTSILLGTAMAYIQDKYGQFRTIRLLVDSGSQHSFITQECVDALGTPTTLFNKTVSGIGHTTLNKSHSTTKCVIKSMKRDTPLLETDAIILPSITHDLPQNPVPAYIWEKYIQFDLADPNFWLPGPIDFLLGADLFAKIILSTPKELYKQEPFLMNTMFGHILIGTFNHEPSATAVSLACCDTAQVESLLHKFWELEQVNSVVKLSEDDRRCEEFFQTTHYRNPTGQYVVALPFKDSHVTLGPSKDIALRRLLSLEVKLSKSPELQHHYSEFMREYLSLGHMCKTSELAGYILPHHGVIAFDDNNKIRKLRVVFDASAKTSKGSLNDKLLTGPKLQADISKVLLNFRLHAVVFTADIVKMYRQIEIRPEDRRYSHILWRQKQSEPVREYELCTVTYGLSCSPYLAIRVLQQLVADEGEAFPAAAKTLLNDVYIDDIVTGAMSPADARTLKSEIISLLAKGGFQLSKWSSNCPEVLADVSQDAIQQPVSLEASDDPTVKILGLQWNPAQDSFSYKVKVLKPLANTKRGILSTIARIYDPLGYISPAVFIAKHLLQRIWVAGVGWDEVVPSDVEVSWQTFIASLPTLSHILIPRQVVYSSEHVHRLVGFCDASEKGYCAVLYLQPLESQHSKHIHLLKAKSKLAPIKTISIPRLELCAALLLAQLYRSISEFCTKVKIKQTVLFTDSSIVMGWLRSPPNRLKTFVAHRISEITESTNITWWHHINSSDNPADIGSRGLMPDELVKNSLWWAGPSWIPFPMEDWPISQVEMHYHNLPELKAEAIAMVVTASTEFVVWTERFSSYLTLIRTFAWVIRFTSNLRKVKKDRISGPLSASEFRNANIKCINLLQHYYYSEVFLENQPLPAFLRSLNPFVDETGLLRVGGRLQHSQLKHSYKHQLLLPKRSHFTSLLVDYYHKIHLHIGPAALNAILHQTYWIPSARSLIKQRKKECLICYKLSQTPQAPFMGDLPASRFSEVKAFHNTGVDFAGPFICRLSRGRKAATSKAYLALFVCFTTKALHLEVVPSLSTEAFLDALDRFTARRGLPARITSDYGTNFKGAANYLIDVYKWLQNAETKEALMNHTSSRGIQWVFNPPHSPHFGGLWEAGVKSVKHLFHRIVGNQPFTENELYTIFAKIEGILNSRPLVPLSNDPSDLEPLTPAHFLVGASLASPPEQDLTELPVNRLSRWQHLRQLVQTFWKRWRTEYLNTLQQRTKWTKPGPAINMGDMVLLKEPNVPPLQWPMGRVVNTHPGKDGIVRVLTIQTAKGTYQRPVVKVVPLPPSTSS